MKKLFLLLFLSLSLILNVAATTYMTDAIMTGTSGLWTDSRAYLTIDDAITDIGATNQTLYIARSETTTALTIPANVRLRFVKDGAINNSGQLTINTLDVSADADRQIFSGTGDIDFVTGSVIRSSWFSDLDEALDVTSDDTLTIVISEAETTTNDMAVGNDVTLRWESPLIITVNAGDTISNIKNIEAENYQIFSGAGDLDFLDGTRLKLSWFNRLRSIVTWVEDEEVILEISTSSEISTDLIIPAGLSIEAGDYQIFSFTGIGALTFPVGMKNPVLPEWFGVIGDGTTDDEDAFEEALASVSENGGNTFKTAPGKTYLFGADGDQEVLFTGSNMIYDFSSSTFNGMVTFGPRAATGQTHDVVVNDGIFHCLDVRGAEADNRYRAWQGSLNVIYANRITFNNPIIHTAVQVAGMQIQTDTTLGADPFQNISNITVNSPIFVGDDGLSPQAMDISCSGAYNNMITDVTVNNAKINNVLRGLEIGHNDPTANYISRIHINNVSMNNVLDTGIDIKGTFYSSVSGTIQNVGWRGLRSYNNAYSTFNLNIHGSDTITIPPFDPADPSLSTQDPAGAYIQNTATSLPTYFPELFITGYDTSDRWDYGMKISGKGAVIGDVTLSFCTIGIDNDLTYGNIFGKVVMDNVTTPFESEHNANNWYDSILITGAPPTVYETSNNYFVEKVTLTNNEIKNLRASPKELVATAGTYWYLELVRVILMLDYGSNVLTEAGDNLVVEYSNGVDISAAIEMTGFIDKNANYVIMANGLALGTTAASSIRNKAIRLFNTGGAEFGGNAGNDTTMLVIVIYRKHYAIL